MARSRQPAAVQMLARDGVIVSEPICSKSAGQGFARSALFQRATHLRGQTSSDLNSCGLLLHDNKGQGSVRVEQKYCFVRLMMENMKAGKLPKLFPFILLVICSCYLPDVTSSKALFVRLKCTHSSVEI